MTRVMGGQVPCHGGTSTLDTLGTGGGRVPVSRIKGVSNNQ